LWFKQQEKEMNSIYTSKGSLIVEMQIWSGVSKYVKSADGTYGGFYRTHNETKFRKTGWGKKARKSFEVAFKNVQAETR
jgi:hypothetical protein